MGEEERRALYAMKQCIIILMLIVFVVLCTVCTIGCVASERKVRIFDVNSGVLMEIRNATSGYTREIAESSPCQSGSTFATLQNRLCHEDGGDRSVVRVYDTNATLLCTSLVPYIYLSPRQFAVYSEKIIFWNSKADAEYKNTDFSEDLCIATLNNKKSIGNIKRITMPLGCGATIDNDESFMWTSPTSVIANVRCGVFNKRVAIINTSSGDFRFLPFQIRSTAVILASFKCSLSRRYFSVVTPNEEIIVCDRQGNICHSFSIDQLRAFGLYGQSMSEALNCSSDAMLTICWDDDDVLWIFNPKGKYVGIDVQTNSVIRSGCVGLNSEEKLIGLIQKRYAVVKQRRSSEFVCSIWGNRFYVKDLKTENCVVEMPNSISSYVYLGKGLMLLLDL